MNKTAAVIVTFNRLALLQECIEAVRMQTVSPQSIIVINNGSTDGTQEWLDAQKDLHILHQENTGGAGGFYSGVKEAFYEGYDYIWLMDDDSIPERDCLKNLAAAFAAIPEISFAASVVVSASGHKTNVPQIDFRVNESTRHPDWPLYIEKGFIKIKENTFVSLLVSAQAVSKVGFPIKEFFIWGDDYEYTYRLSDFKPGYLVLNSVVVHKAAAEKPPSLAWENDTRRLRLHFYGTRNKVYLFRKQRTGFRKWFGILSFLISGIRLLGNPNGHRKFGFFFKGFIHGMVFRPKTEQPG